MDGVEVADGHDRFVPTVVDAHYLRVAHEGRYDWVVENWDLAGLRVLDFGCGVGYGTQRLAEHALAADGVDISSTAIRYAKKHHAASNVRYLVGDLSGQLPDGLERSSYDLVCSSEVLEHVPDVFSFLYNLSATMKPDGTAIIGTPNRLWTYRTYGRLASSSHYMELTPRTLVNLLFLFFERVHLFFHVVRGSGLDDDLQSREGTPIRHAGRRVIRASRRAASAFCRKALTPDRYAALSRRVRPPAHSRESEPMEVRAEFVLADDFDTFPGSAMGLVAVCELPTDFEPALRPADTAESRNSAKA